MVIRIEINIDYERIQYIANLLKPLREDLITLHYKDPQFTAIKKLVEIHGCSGTALLVLLNSIVSYQLTMIGEEYWKRFSEFFSAKKSIQIEDFKVFLLRNNPKQVDQKYNRIRKLWISDLSGEILENGLKYCSRLVELARILANVLNTDEYSKTIVFAVKMYGYLCEICGLMPNYTGISIPVDYRNTLLALTSCIVSTSRINAVKIVSSNADIVQRVLVKLCNSIQIPCPILDTFTWLFTGIIIEAGFDLIKTIKSFKETYGVQLSLELVKALIECKDKYNIL